MKYAAWDFANDRGPLDWISVSIPAPDLTEPSPYNDMIDWCKQTESDGVFYPCIVAASNVTFFFSQESDAVLFRLRW